MDKFEILKKLVSFRTDGNEQNINECLKYVEKVFNDYGWKTELIKNNEDNKLNLVAVLNGELENITDGLLLAGHIDTVQTNLQAWTSNPFDVTKIEDNLYGLGIADMKSFTAAIISNLEEIKKLKLKKPLIFTLTNDEETVMFSINRVVEYFKTKNIRPSFSIIGEPSSMIASNSNKGFYEFETIINGVACHSSNPQLGTNAIYIMSKFITFLENLSKQFKSTTINVGLINGGRMCNIVADKCDIRWDVRTASRNDLKQITEKAKEFLMNLMMDYKNATFSNEIVFQIPVFEKRDNEISDMILEKYSLEERPYAASTEAGFYQELGIDCMVFGCGDIEDAHAINEKININKYSDYCDLMLSFIKDICC